MSRIRFSSRRIAWLAPLLLFAAVLASCGVIPFDHQPAAGYVYGSGAPLKVAVLDQAGGDWSPAIDASLAAYGATTPYLQFQRVADGANIVIAVHRYSDETPPELSGYVFPAGVGGFAAVYDVHGAACNFPPSALPVNCTGEIATAAVYLNDIIPAGADIEARRERLILHEVGHALGLTRHSPDPGVVQLAQRYGWPE